MKKGTHWGPSLTNEYFFIGLIKGLRSFYGNPHINGPLSIVKYSGTDIPFSLESDSELKPRFPGKIPKNWVSFSIRKHQKNETTFSMEKILETKDNFSIEEA